MIIYCCHPISGCSADDVFKYYDTISKQLRAAGYEVLTPMFGKDVLRTELKFKANDYRDPVSCNHAIFNRDKWMVHKSDVVYANLCGSTLVSIGTMMELAWAAQAGKHVVVAMEPDNIHRHAFVLEAANIVWDSEQDAFHYIVQLVRNIKGPVQDSLVDRIMSVDPTLVIPTGLNC